VGICLYNKHNKIYNLIVNKRGKLACCGQDMVELVAQTADSTTEKHVPVVEVNGNEVLVTVGSTLHPMTEAHLINAIILETTNGFQRKDLTANDEPKAKFALLDGEKVVAAYEYCNLHGLWVKEL